MFFGLFGKQPSTDWHQIDLAWVLNKMRESEEKIEQLESELRQAISEKQQEAYSEIYRNLALLESNATASVERKLNEIEESVLGAASGVECDLLFDGACANGQVLDLSGIDLIDYDLFIVEATYESSYSFKGVGVYSPSGYYGDGMNAACSFYSTGGFFYQIALYVSNESGAFHSDVSVPRSSSSYSSNVVLNRLYGYKFREPNNAVGFYELT